MSTIQHKEKEDVKTNAVDPNLPVAVNMFDKFEKALEMDAKGTPRSTIIYELDVSSATFYKWIKNPKYWADRYKTKPTKLMRTTNTIIASLKRKDVSMSSVKSLLKDLQLGDYELEFLYQYIQKRNSTEAMLRTLPQNVDMTRNTAKLKALKLLQRKNVREAMDRILQWEMEGIHLTLANDIIGTLYRMAFYDPAMFIDGAGKSRFKTLDDIPEEYRCCVAGIKTVFHPKDVTKIYYDIQLVDRTIALKELMQYAKLYDSNTQGLNKIGEGLGKIASLLEENKIKSSPKKGDIINPNFTDVTEVEKERLVSEISS